MKLYAFWRSSASWRARLALQLKGIAYEYVPVNLGTAEQHSEAYGRVNPLHQVPTLVLNRDGQTVTLSQSVAIIELLEELYPTPALLPEDPLLRARVRQVVEVINSGTQPLQNTSVLHKIEQLANSDESAAWAREQILRGLKVVAHLLGPVAGRYSFGDSITLADLFLIPQIYNARRFGADLTELGTLVAIDARCAAISAFQRAHPDAQPDAPARQP